MIEKLLKKTLILIILLLFPISAFAEDYCGDGLKNEEHGEECDDGNFINRDGCDSYCKLEDMTPPEVTLVSIAEGATGVSTITENISILFSEPIDPDTINEDTVQLKQHINILDTELEMQSNGRNLTININEDLYGEMEHSIVIKNVYDVPGNMIPDIFVRKFTTGVSIDNKPPNIVIEAEGGEYHITQSVTLTPYIGEETYSEDFLDEGAVIYYTLDGSEPTTNSSVYSGSLSIKTNTTLKYFGVDKKGNVGPIETHTYRFTCGERPNATKITPYPICSIQECDYGFQLKNNACVINLSASDEDDYKINAATAPLFGSSTPMMISTKPALYITPEHRGVIPRPIIFKDTTSGTTIEFQRDTGIKTKDGKAFSGYLIPPKNLYSKNYPINFGYTFKSIFKFEPAEEEELIFTPPYQITIPFTERFDPEEPVTVFTYDARTEKYNEYDPALVSVNETDEEVTIITENTDAYFVAQPGKSYNKTIFEDCVDHWSQNYVEALYREGIVKGRSKGVFAPDDILTRAEFTKIALNAIGEEVDPLEEIEDSPFHDVTLYAWYVAYIKRAKETGLIHGYPDGSFRPDQPINKAEAIKILMNAFGFDIHSAGQREDSYRDLDPEQWYFPAVNFAIKNGLVDGKLLSSGIFVNHLFAPAQNITRGEMAKITIKTIEFNEQLDSD